MDINSNLRKTEQLRRELREKNEGLRKERETKRLMDSIEKHFKTTFIGALNAVEKEFGLLWGAGLPESELSEDEYNWRKRWEIVRTNILNNGNNERRASLAEL